MLALDFNESTCQDEKKGGRDKFMSSGFTNWILNSSMIDLGFPGQKFTWFKTYHNPISIKVRLDRARCNQSRRIAFLKAYVLHLPRMNSNQSLILIFTHKNYTSLSDAKPFRF